jgi:hypothetical protein
MDRRLPFAIGDAQNRQEFTLVSAPLRPAHTHVHVKFRTRPQVNARKLLIFGFETRLPTDLSRAWEPNMRMCN